MLVPNPMRSKPISLTPPKGTIPLSAQLLIVVKGERVRTPTQKETMNQSTEALNKKKTYSEFLIY